MKNATKKFVQMTVPDLEDRAWQNMDCGQIACGYPPEVVSRQNRDADNFRKGKYKK